MEKRLEIFSTIDHIKGVGKKYTEIFNKRNIFTIIDLLQVFPIKYIDFSRPQSALSSEYGVYDGLIQTVKLSRNFRRRMSLLRLDTHILDNKVEVLFFNKPYLADQFEKDKRHLFYGKIEWKESKYILNNPVLPPEDSQISVVPLYRSIGTIKQGNLRKIIKNALAVLATPGEFLPPAIIEKHRFPSLHKAFSAIHQPTPDSLGNIDSAVNRFKFSEFLFYQLELQYMRQLLANTHRRFQYRFSQEMVVDIKRRLTFQLTGDQARIIMEIQKALSEPYGLTGLIQGDVGSGKTVIAFLALLMAVQSGFQGAILVPTEVLAIQHHTAGLTFFSDYRIEILTGSTPVAERRQIVEDLQQGNINIIIGTHSLLNEEIRFRNLSMIIIDEQHKFGVTQRATLFYKNLGIDMLVLTATPIPRTMLLSMYNDLRLFILKDKPAGRKPVQTKIIPRQERTKFYTWLKTGIKNRQKVYIILPLIEPSEFFADLRSIEGEKGYFKKILAPYKLGFISGKIEKEKRDNLLKQFKSGKIQVIISTTVIEVGIDVTDATIIVIEDADRYGLAALHQLRGRVGRGFQQSHCYVIPSKNIGNNGKKRLKKFSSENDGFKIAEYDLKMRGGGQISGVLQSGDLVFRNADIKNDYALFKEAIVDAGEILDSQSKQIPYIKKALDSVKQKSREINFS